MEALKTDIPTNQEVKHYVVDSNQEIQINFTHSRRILDFLKTENKQLKLYGLLSHSIDVCLEIIDKCIKSNYEFRIGLPFNGGKEATAVFHIARASLYQYCKQNNLEVLPTYLKIFHVFFVYNEPQFDEIIEYIDWAQKEYNFTLHVYSNKSFAKSLILADKLYQLTYCFLGIRYTDYKGAAEIIYATPGFPNVVRVNPVFYYTIADVFDLLLRFDISYCKLYDLGYSSLGGKFSTKQNSKLKWEHKHESMMSILDKGNAETSETEYSILDELIKNGLEPSCASKHFRTESDYLPSFMLNFNEVDDRAGRDIK